jgi:hypothetical protein
MARKPKPEPPPPELDQPADDLPPEQIAERMERALTKAFTLPHKPRPKPSPARRQQRPNRTKER